MDTLNTLDDWQVIALLIACALGLLLAGVALGYAWCRAITDRKVRRWLGTYAKHPLNTSKPPTPIKAQPATNKRVKKASEGITPDTKVQSSTR